MNDRDTPGIASGLSRALPYWLLATVLIACEVKVDNPRPRWPKLVLYRVEPAVVLPSSQLRLDVTGLVDDPLATHSLRLEGTLDGVPLDVTLAAIVRGPRTLGVTTDGALHLLPRGLFVGQATVTRDGPDGPSSSSLHASLRLDSQLVPTLAAVPHRDVFLGDTLIAEGGALLHPSEGFTLARFNGTLTLDSGEQRTINDLLVPGFTAGQWNPSFSAANFWDTSTRLDRKYLGLLVSPDLFGIRPGRFVGTLSLVNTHADGLETHSDSLPLELVLHRPMVTGLSPSTVSRGQYLSVLGRGFATADDLLQTATVMILEGVFTPRRGPSERYEGNDALYIYPEDLDGNGHFVTVLRVDVGPDGELVGLGRRAGRFVGRITPVVVAGPDVVAGDSFEVTFDIANPRQMVQIRFLPGFVEALARFGLSTERSAIEARILEVSHRDFAAVNIRFVYETPTNFAEYTIIEIAGVDPNQRGLFGLDNTSGKDVGNQRFDDVIGGYNAETRAGNLAAYGGVFASELMNLSPVLSDNPLASPRFDDIFGEFAPELGGLPAERNESNGPRGPMLREAVRVLGNLIGTTITHEVGHALGLTAIEGRYHNDGDTPNALMDAGIFRPFEERAELDGFGPATLEPFNRLYLESILPLD